MSPLHHDRVLDAGAVPSSDRTPAPAESTSAQPVLTPRPGDAQPSGDPLTHRTAVGVRSAENPSADVDDLRPTEQLAEVTDLADLTGLAEATARAGMDQIAAAPAADRPRRCLPAWLRRRPAVYVAATVTGAVGLGLLWTSGPVAQAGGSESVSRSVSVAEELGLDERSQTTDLEADDAAARLGEMAASRTAREAEQAAAAQAQAEADRLAAEAAAEAARPDAVLPVAGARITSGFGARWGTLHAGVDFAAPMLTPEYAAMDGVVLEAGPASGYGQAVYIQHQNRDVTVYGHMEQILVQPGQVVRAGDTIALLGNRGQSTGPHLHFEVHVGGIDGEKIDPLPWLQAHGVAV